MTVKPAARRGFTLLEVVFAAMLLAVVMAGVMQGYMGMRRAQGASVSQNLLKMAGQKALKAMYLDLSQSRKLLASSTLDAASKDLGREYFNRFTGVDAPPAANVVFPRINPDGGFGRPGNTPGDFDPADIGNTLTLVAAGDRLDVAPPLVAIAYGSMVPTVQWLSVKPYALPTYRFVAYYMAETLLKSGTSPIRISAGQRRSYTLELRRWESGVYLEKGEFEDLAAKVVGGGVVVKPLWDWLVANKRVAGLWDSGATTAANAFYTVNASGAVVAVANPAIAERREIRAADTDLASYAVGMVAFNTVATGASDDYAFPDFTVPAYAPTDVAHANIPYGFEVGIAGPTGARSVLVRLALASRVNTGGHVIGVSQQEVIKALDM
jgi:prepilin-type N-terminal cleavage/methylation domain-containing protein